jgi:hypothetical protein
MILKNMDYWLLKMVMNIRELGKCNISRQGDSVSDTFLLTRKENF